jgi:flagellar assembly protein FliH
MLSRVVPAAGAGGIRAAVFPSVSEPPGPGYEPPPPAGETLPLREKIRALEAQLAAARSEAFESGRQQGDRQARAELQPVSERLSASVADLARIRQDLRRRAERDVVQLALLIARRVLHREMNVDENALNALARVAFDRMARSESYSVTVHPRFATAIRESLPASQASRVTIETDPACAPGTLIFHSAEGVIDASVETQLEEINRGLTDRLELAPPA